MKLKEIRDEQSRIFAFEVPNFGRHRACKLVSTIPGAEVIKKQKPFQCRSEEAFCVFRLEGITFVVQEPFNDNSQYWVGPDPPAWCPQIEQVRQAFSKFKRYWLI